MNNPKLDVDKLFPTSDVDYLLANLPKLILSTNRYLGRSRQLDFTPDPEIIIPGDQELIIMQKQLKTHGKFVS